MGVLIRKAEVPIPRLVPGDINPHAAQHGVAFEGIATPFGHEAVPVKTGRQIGLPAPRLPAVEGKYLGSKASVNFVKRFIAAGVNSVCNREAAARQRRDKVKLSSQLQRRVD